MEILKHVLSCNLLTPLCGANGDVIANPIWLHPSHSIANKQPMPEDKIIAWLQCL